MKNLFSYCSSLDLLDLSSFCTNSVKDMIYMFNYCTSLTSLNLSNFNTNNVLNMNHMFFNCSSIISLIYLILTQKIMKISVTCFHVVVL